MHVENASVLDKDGEGTMIQRMEVWTHARMHTMLQGIPVRFEYHWQHADGQSGHVGRPHLAEDLAMPVFGHRPCTAADKLESDCSLMQYSHIVVKMHTFLKRGA